MSRPLSRYRCKTCGAVHDGWAANCGACGASGAVAGLRLVTSGDGAPPPPSAKYAIGRANVERGYRIHCGIPELDRVFGKDRPAPDAPASYGLHVPSAVVFAGEPGTGKTTLVVQLFAKLIEKHTCLFVSSEQSRGEILETIEDLGLIDALRDLPVLGTDVGGNDWNEVLAAYAEVRPRIVAIDSLTKLEDPARDTPDREGNTKRLLTAIRLDAFENERAVFVISHLNKKMEMRGTKELEHDVSALMMAYQLPKNRVRVVCPTKNRFGKTGVAALFDMADGGLVALDPEELKREEEQRKADADLDRELGLLGPGAFAPRRSDDDE